MLKKGIFLILLIGFLSGCQTIKTETTTKETTMDNSVVEPDELAEDNGYFLVVNEQEIYYGKDQETFQLIYKQDQERDFKLCGYTTTWYSYYGCGILKLDHYLTFNYDEAIIDVKDGSVYKPKYSPNGQIIYLTNNTYKDIDLSPFKDQRITIHDDLGEKFILGNQYYVYTYYDSTTSKKISLPKLANYNDSFSIFNLNNEFTLFAGINRTTKVISIFDINDLNNIIKIENSQFLSIAQENLFFTKEDDDKVYYYESETKEISPFYDLDGVDQFVVYSKDLFVYKKANKMYFYNTSTNEHIYELEYKVDHYIIKLNQHLFIQSLDQMYIYSLENKSVVSSYQGIYYVHGNPNDENQVVLYNQDQIIWYSMNGTTVQNNMTHYNPNLLYPIITTDFIYLPNTNKVVYKDASRDLQISNDQKVRNAYLVRENLIFVYFTDGSAYHIYNDKIENINWISEFMKNKQ